MATKKQTPNIIPLRTGARGRPVGSTDAYQRERVSSREVRVERLVALSNALMDPSLPAGARDTLARSVIAWQLIGWSPEAYLRDMTAPDWIARLLDKLPGPKAPRSRVRQTTNLPGL
jgi:hypothetical protein